MPTLPEISRPVIGPSQSQNVRADTGMYDKVAQAGENVGNAIGGAADEAHGFAMKIQAATDQAAMMRIQSKQQAAETEFQTWTLQNPDTTKWADKQAEIHDSVAKNTEDDYNQLSGWAKPRADAQTDHWGRTFDVTANHLQAQQQIRNAEGTFKVAYYADIDALDSKALSQHITDAVQHGVFAPQVGAKMLEDGNHRINAGIFSQDALSDPFTAHADLLAGKYDFLNSHQKVMAAFQSTKLMNETRSETMRTLAQAVDEDPGKAQDPEFLRTLDVTAEHMGISPKWVKKLITPTPEFDKGAFAEASNGIMKLDLVNDPDHQNLAQAMAYATQFKGAAGTKLQDMIKEGQDPNSHRNHPNVIAGDKEIEDQFNEGAFGKFKFEASGTKGEPDFSPAHQDTEMRSAANVKQAAASEAFHAWARLNPDKITDRVAVAKQLQAIIHPQARTNMSNAVLKGTFKPYNPLVPYIP